MPALDVIVRRHVDALVAEIKAAVKDGIVELVGRVRDGDASVRRLTPRGRFAARRRWSTKGQKMDMRCLSPDCSNRSRGPRFRYLCQAHQRASEKHVAEWRELRRKEKANGRGVSG